MVVVGLDRISTLITDDGATKEELEVFKAAGITVVTVSADTQIDAAGPASTRI
jgi:DeoR/GlpR family transcriptional regulator of sugar metabolism